MKKIDLVLDTSALMQYADKLEEDINKYNYYVSYIVASELDNLKESKNPNKSFKARKGLRFIENNEDTINFIVNDYVSENLPKNFDTSVNDNKIISVALEKKCAIATNDRGMKIKAQALNIEVIDLNSNKKEYKGYRYLELDLNSDGDQVVLSNFYQNPEDNSLGLHTNEYLIIRDVANSVYDDECDQKIGYKTIDILRWDGDKYVNLKTPPKRVVSPLNDIQKCALDLLCNDNIPIKLIMGNYGSGKTLMSTKVGVHLIEDKGKYAKMFLVRNPVGSGAEIGFLPGSKKEKIQDFFKPMIQHFPNGEFQAEHMMQHGKLEMEVTYYMKGLSIGDSYMIVDEAEDLDVKIIKLIGSRIEDNSCIVFSGDYKQSEKQFINNNGLLHLANMTKDEKLVGTIVLDEDVRSSASKVFANL